MTSRDCRQTSLAQTLWSCCDTRRLCLDCFAEISKNLLWKKKKVSTGQHVDPKAACSVLFSINGSFANVQLPPKRTHGFKL